MSRIRFYMVRLKKASIPEIAHRVLERGSEFAWLRLRTIRAILVKAPAVPVSHLTGLKLPELMRTDDVSRVPSLLDGFVWSSGEDLKQIRDFESCWRGTSYAKIKLSSGDPDIRSVWEPARLQNLMYLLDASTREPDGPNVKYVKTFCAEALMDWVEENPFLIGPHYLSVMECGLRIPVFVYALKILDLSTESQEKILQVIYEHAWIIEQRLSLYSSLGNHTVAEALGLLVAGLVFQKSAKGKKWYSKGKKYLEKECEREILEDGGPIEQSSSYHRFVLDLFSWGHWWIELNDPKSASSMKQRLLLGESFWDCLKLFHCYPGFGDTDSGSAVAPGLGPVRFKPDLPPPTVDKDWSVWVFEDTGITLCEHSKSGIMLTFDHGPLGMLPLCNHGHADALSVTLAYQNSLYFTDPGTYRYNGVPRYREYFRGTSAHNSVTIDGLDQTEQLTGFVWENTFELKAESPEITDTGIRLRASHYGYSRSKEGVVHTREVFLAADGSIEIDDFFTGCGHHKFSLNFHLDPQVEVVPKESGILLDNQGKKLYLSSGRGIFQQFMGEEQPLLGWFSESYGALCKTTTLCNMAEGSPEKVSFKTRIQRV
jgi:hypothetical protein